MVQILDEEEKLFGSLSSKDLESWAKVIETVCPIKDKNIKHQEEK